MDGTAPEPLPQAAPAQRGPLSVREAARALGIGERAVRKRIAAGTLPAQRVDGAWLVALDRPTPALQSAGTAPLGRNPGNGAIGPRGKGTGTANGPVPVPAEGPAPAALALQAALLPLVDRIARLEHALGREEQRREQAEARAEAEAAQRQAAEARAAQLAAQLAAIAPPTAPAVPRPAPAEAHGQAPRAPGAAARPVTHRRSWLGRLIDRL